MGRSRARRRPAIWDAPRNAGIAMSWETGSMESRLVQRENTELATDGHR